MSISHIVSKVLPSTLNYVLTATGTEGKGIWSNPAVNPLIPIPEEKTTTYNYTLLNGTEVTITLSIPTNSPNVIMNVTNGVGVFSPSSPYVSYGPIPVGYRMIPPLMDVQEWYMSSACIDASLVFVHNVAFINTGTNDLRVVKPDGSSFSGEEGPLQQTYTWPLLYPVLGIASPSFIMSNAISQKRIDLESKMSTPKSTTSEDSVDKFIDLSSDVSFL